MNEIIIWFLLMIVVCISAFVQGFSGFAFSLVLVPLLSLYLPFQDVIIINMILSFVLNVNVFTKIRKYISLKSLKYLIIPACIFTAISASLVDNINETTFKIFIGALLIISVIIKIFNVGIKITNYQKYYPIVGSISGILNGISGIGGPPLILYFQNVEIDKMKYKAIFNATFLSLNIVALIFYGIYGYYSFVVIKFSLISTIFVVIGSSLGLALSKKVSEETFRSVLLVIIFIMGLSLIVSGINN